MTGYHTSKRDITGFYSKMMDTSSHLPGNVTSESARFWIACRHSQRMGGTLKDSLLIAVTKLLCCCSEERRVTVEYSCENRSSFQVQSAYESLCWRDSTQYPNTSQPYVSRPIDTTSIPSRSWSCSPATHLFLLDLSPVKSTWVSIVFPHLAIWCLVILLPFEL